MTTTTKNRISPVAKDKASGNVKPIFEQMERNMGKVPNIFLNMANSPEALQAFVAMQEKVEKSSLSKALKEALALTVAEANHCNYCLSAHTVIAKAAGLQEQEILNARRAHASNKKEQAILTFAKLVIDKKANVSDADVAQLKAEGVSDKELCEIVLAITLNIYTNYFNKVMNTENDFPPASKL
jgi:uncharacterized peroxidase-related enzyme